MEPPDYPATIASLLHHAVAVHGEREFVVSGEARTTFAQAERGSAQLAARLLAAGIGKGTRVGILMPNTPDWAVVFLAVTRIGALAVLISTTYQRRDLAHVLRHGDIDTLFMAGKFLNHDYVARLEEIAPELRGQEGVGDLRCPSLPLLRRVYVWGAWPGWGRSAEELLEWRPAAGDELLRAVEAQVTPADLCLVIYTSGSTAAPKGIVHAHGPIVRRPHIVRGQKMYEADDRLLQLGPFCWVGGVLSLLWALEIGLCVVCPPDPKTETVVATIAREKPTRIQAQPGQIKLLRAHPGVAAMDPATVRFLDGERGADGELIAEDRFSRGLGMTETVAMHSLELWGEMAPDKVGAFGRGAPDIERRIRDPETGDWLGPDREGELWVRGPGVLNGLYKEDRAEVFDADGFYPTGDRCRIDADGFLYFLGRSGEMIKTGGANVSPREVEAAIEAYPEVEEAGVFALPGEGHDQMVAAVVIVRPGTKLSPDDLRQRLRGEISAFKIPKLVFVETYEATPRTRSGKLDKRQFAKAVIAGERGPAAVAYPPR
jgi:acyl-coenzyme A synthetase/AMP-(fatty) acid ligase